MKKFVLISAILLSTLNTSYSQEWFTSFEVATSFAKIKNRLLFVIWEDSLNDAYPLAFTDEKGKGRFIDLSVDDSLDALIWEHFVPVKLPEDQYDTFISKAKNRSLSYKDKLNDESIKIMDYNGNILNTKPNYNGYDNLNMLIKKYALNTSFLKQDLVNYAKQRNFTTAFNLATKYSDFAILTDKLIRPEVIKLGTIYLDDARALLIPETADNPEAYIQRLDLTAIKMDLVLNKPRKANRLLKKLEKNALADFNTSLYNSLKYIIFKTNEDDDSANLLKDAISSSDLKKAEFILKNNN